MLTLLSAMEEMTVSTIMPKISSMTAAPKMVLATFVFSLPSSFKVSTVMLTLVAVRITPMNICCRMLSPAPKIAAMPHPISRGTMTPMVATMVEETPTFFKSLILVSKPAVNINTITPISEILSIKSVSSKTEKPNNGFKIAGPSKSPANNAPTT